MQELRQIAEQTSSYVNKIVFIKPTADSENQLSKKQRTHHAQVIRFIRFEFSGHKDAHNQQDQNFLKVKPSMPQQLAHACKYNTGNCHECALLAYDYLSKHAPHIQKEIVILRHANYGAIDSHVFLRLIHETKILYCDPFLNSIFEESEQEEKMKTWRSTKHRTEICPYSESTQELEIDTDSTHPLAWRPTIEIIEMYFNITYQVLEESFPMLLVLLNKHFTELTQAIHHEKNA